ncbi:MAG TPA: peptide ABC transporter substrate-binding protein [Phenylobacterium sp.]|uniref:peptide ABC transporter substrate-binding protein n=1 Tax=Phenylobacterium sp. TaxID=1871053 RepID=UPI002B4593C6|nr:peptide ABC transporter substrate-binding protein [Phenylobacterium sp.]HKR88990.1 peptide ABC transporter substrate-binding protein [Phenylobacterium sp.]
MASIRFRRLLAVLAVAGLCACQGGAQRPACPAGKVCLEYGDDSEPNTLDPSKAQLVAETLVIGDLMMGLATEAADGAVLPGMAERWETSPDGLTWTFQLRPARWSDGVPVTADDFVFAYRRILDPKTGSPYAYMVEILKNGAAANAGKAPLEAVGARALGPHTLELRLEHPAPYLPQLLTHQSFYPVPAHAVGRYGDGWVAPGRYVSNGAYQLVSWRLGDKITVEKNPQFFDAAHVCVDRINYYPAADYVAAERRVARGELDATTMFQSNRLQHIRETLPGYARTHLWLSTGYITFNGHDPGPLRDRRVRRALSEAIDRRFITAELLRAGQTPAYAFVPPGTANAQAGPRTAWAGKSFAARQAEARALLAQAGYGPDNPLKLELKTATATDSMLLSQAVQADWRAIGVEAKILQTESQILFADLNARNFQVGFVNWIADFDDPLTFLGLFQSTTGAQNYGDYANPAYDALLAAADQEPDAKRRAALLARAEQTMLNDEAVAPVYFGVTRNLVSPRVTGWEGNMENRHRARWLCVRSPERP